MRIVATALRMDRRSAERYTSGSLAPGARESMRGWGAHARRPSSSLFFAGAGRYTRCMDSRLASSRPRPARGKAAGFVLMLLLWLASFAASASPQVHHWIHDDADAPGHDCFVTRLHEQSPWLDAAPPAVVVPMRPGLTPEARPASPAFSPSRGLLPPGRGPPALPASPQVPG
jgi:hypothetical protein